MKKVFVMVAAVAALTLASCDNKNAAPQAGADSTVVDSATVDSEVAAVVGSGDVEQLTSQLAQQLDAKDAGAVVSLLSAAREKAAELAKNDPEQAKQYVSQLQEWVKANAAAIKGVVASAGDEAVSNAVSNAIGAVTTINPSDVVNSIAAATEADAKNAGAQLLEKAKEDAANAVKDSKVGEAAEKAADAAEKVKSAKEAVENAPAAAKKAAEDAANKGREKVNKKVNETANKVNEATSKAVNDAAGKALKGLGL